MRGSLKWIQRLVNDRPEQFNFLLRPSLDECGEITWLSPRREDGYAEYRDADFLTRVGAAELIPALAAFWPHRGPQWDALGTTARGDILLVEAKAHVAEILSPPTQASAASRAMIDRALRETAEAIGATPRAPWTDVFFQYANRLAHLQFLRKHGRQAWLIFVYFTGDTDMRGPASEAEWRGALTVAHHVLGLPDHHRHARHVIDVFVHVSGLETPSRSRP